MRFPFPGLTRNHKTVNVSRRPAPNPVQVFGTPGPLRPGPKRMNRRVRTQAVCFQGTFFLFQNRVLTPHRSSRYPAGTVRSVYKLCAACRHRGKLARSLHFLSCISRNVSRYRQYNGFTAKNKGDFENYNPLMRRTAVPSGKSACGVCRRSCSPFNL